MYRHRDCILLLLYCSSTLLLFSSLSPLSLPFLLLRFLLPLNKTYIQTHVQTLRRANANDASPFIHLDPLSVRSSTPSPRPPPRLSHPRFLSLYGLVGRASANSPLCTPKRPSSLPRSRPPATFHFSGGVELCWALASTANHVPTQSQIRTAASCTNGPEPEASPRALTS